MEPSTTIRVFRAVSEKEHQQILRTGRFETTPESCEGKHFAGSLEGASKFGEMLYGRGEFSIVEADVPAEARSLYRWSDLDGCGPAFFLHIADLLDVTPRPTTGETPHG